MNCEIDDSMLLAVEELLKTARKGSDKNLLASEVTANRKEEELGAEGDGGNRLVTATITATATIATTTMAETVTTPTMTTTAIATATITTATDNLAKTTDEGVGSNGGSIFEIDSTGGAVIDDMIAPHAVNATKATTTTTTQASTTKTTMTKMNLVVSSEEDNEVEIAEEVEEGIGVGIGIGDTPASTVLMESDGGLGQADHEVDVFDKREREIRGGGGNGDIDVNVNVNNDDALHGNDGNDMNVRANNDDGNNNDVGDGNGGGGGGGDEDGNDGDEYNDMIEWSHISEQDPGPGLGLGPSLQQLLEEIPASQGGPLLPDTYERNLVRTSKSRTLRRLLSFLAMLRRKAKEVHGVVQEADQESRLKLEQDYRTALQDMKVSVPILHSPCQYTSCQYTLSTPCQFTLCQYILSSPYQDSLLSNLFGSPYQPTY